jgi:hypothetical protein
MGPVIFLIIRNNWPPAGNKTIAGKIVFITYILLIILYFAALGAGRFNYYIKGYLSTSIVFLLMTLSGIVYWLVDRSKVLTSFLRAILFCFTIVTISFSTFLTFELFYDYNKQLVYNDRRYRLEETGRGIMSPCGFPALFVKSSFLERKYRLSDGETDYCLSKRIIAVKLQRVNIKQVIVTFVLKEDSSSQIQNPLKVVYQEK